jgi:hypothetical protein
VLPALYSITHRLTAVLHPMIEQQFTVTELQLQLDD